MTEHTILELDDDETISLRTQIKTLASKNKSCEKETNRLQDRLSAADGAIADLQDTVKKLESAKEISQNNLFEADQKNADLQKENLDLQDRVGFREDVIERLEGRCERLTSVNNTLSNVSTAIINEIKEEVK